MVYLVTVKPHTRCNCLRVRIWNPLIPISHFDQAPVKPRGHFWTSLGCLIKDYMDICIYISWSLIVELTQATFGSSPKEEVSTAFGGWMDTSSGSAAIQTINILLPHPSFNLPTNSLRTSGGISNTLDGMGVGEVTMSNFIEGHLNRRHHRGIWLTSGYLLGLTVSSKILV